MASHNVKIHIMKTVSPGTREIILRRARIEGLKIAFEERSALAVLHGDVCDMIFASDVAQKTSDVQVFEIPGSCPQHMTCLAILGDAEAVEVAAARIEEVLTTPEPKQPQCPFAHTNK